MGARTALPMSLSDCTPAPDPPPPPPPKEDTRSLSTRKLTCSEDNESLMIRSIDDDDGENDGENDSDDDDDDDDGEDDDDDDDADDGVDDDDASTDR